MNQTLNGIIDKGELKFTTMTPKLLRLYYCTILTLSKRIIN